MERVQNQRYNKIAIDCNNLFWRSAMAYTKKALSTEGAFVYSHVILDFLDRVKQLQSQFGYDNTKMYLLFDNPKSKITTRKMIDEYYKSHRHNDSVPKEFWDTLALLTMIIRCYSDNFIVMQLDNCEADDLVYPLIKERVSDKDKLLLVSVDLDWSRGLSLSENVHWFNYHTLFWHKEIFKEEYGFYPEKNKVKFFKMIRGDKSDDIPAGIPNLPAPILNHIIENYDEMPTFMETFNRDKDIPSQWKVKILENRSRLLTNYSLVDFIHIEEDISSYSFQCKSNVNELRYWYNLLDLPFENRMKIKKDNSSFLKAKKTKYIKRIEL